VHGFEDGAAVTMFAPGTRPKPPINPAEIRNNVTVEILDSKMSNCPAASPLHRGVVDDHVLSFISG